MKTLAALAITLASAIVGAMLYERMSAQEAAAEDAAFDPQRAMDLAGAAVPPEVESFYFFILQRGGPDESAELAQKLRQAADESDYVGIVGSNARHNRRVLLAALLAARPSDLRNLVIVYVGPVEQEAELDEAVGRAGAKLQFVPYTPAPLEFEEVI